MEGGLAYHMFIGGGSPGVLGSMKGVKICLNIGVKCLVLRLLSDLKITLSNTLMLNV